MTQETCDNILENVLCRPEQRDRNQTHPTTSGYAENKCFFQPFCASASHWQLHFLTDFLTAGLKGLQKSAKTWILLPSVMQLITEFVFESTGTWTQQHVTNSQKKKNKLCRIWQEIILKAYWNCSVMFSWSNQSFHRKKCWLEQENYSSEAEKYSFSVLHQQLLAVIAQPLHVSSRYIV